MEKSFICLEVMKALVSRALVEKVWVDPGLGYGYVEVTNFRIADTRDPVGKDVYIPGTLSGDGEKFSFEPLPGVAKVTVDADRYRILHGVDAVRDAISATEEVVNVTMTRAEVADIIADHLRDVSAEGDGDDVDDEQIEAFANAVRDGIEYGGEFRMSCLDEALAVRAEQGLDCG